MQAIAEVPLADERTTEAHDFDPLFPETGSGVFHTLYAYTVDDETSRRKPWRKRSHGPS